MKSQNNEIEQQKIEITNAYVKLQEVESLKESLSSMIVHDLKNPINSIINIPDLYDDENLKDYIKTIGFSMLNLVTNILEIQKYESNEIILFFDKINVKPCLENILKQVVMLANQKNINIELFISQDLIIHGDKEMFERIVINLLTNAIKFAPSNSQIKVFTKSENKLEKFFITDMGAGIPENLETELFQKYKQIMAVHSGLIKSTGLGLAFCKLAVEAHGGEIGYFRENETSHFWFTLPLISKENNSITSKIDHFKKSEISKDIQIIANNILPELNKLKIFEISQIIALINQIENNEAEFKQWKKQVLQAVYAGNDKLYRLLIKTDE